MRCLQCGSSSRDGSRYCANCGAKIVINCLTCGADNDLGSDTCARCRRSLEDGASPANRFRSARELQESFLQSRQMLSGERKDVTVLFADISGSTELARPIHDGQG